MFKLCKSFRIRQKNSITLPKKKFFNRKEGSSSGEFKFEFKIHLNSLQENRNNFRVLGQKPMEKDYQVSQKPIKAFSKY